MTQKTNTSRRRFIGGAAAAIAAPTIIPASVLGQNAPSNRIQMGFVGMGNRGRGVMTALMNHQAAQGVAVCDLDKSYESPNSKKARLEAQARAKSAAIARAEGQDVAEVKIPNKSLMGLNKGIELLNAANAKKGGAETGVKGYSDYREMIANENLDAIMVATPDHWHAMICMEAARNGLDIYCEKPITHLFAEGYHLHREVAERDLIFQVGSQQRSSKEFRTAVEIVRNGLIGKITQVEVGLPPGKTEAQNDATIKEPPASLDYDRWCGPSEKLPYMDARSHWNWRWHLSYGGGQLMDWIGHHNDIAHWGLDMDKAGPLSVEAKNFEYISELLEIYNSPLNYEVVCEYPNDVELTLSSYLPKGTKFIGQDGWVHVTRGKLTASNPAFHEAGFVAGDWKGYHPGAGHQSNFIEGVINRKETICPAETGHRSATPGHLGYLSQKLGRKIKWDSEMEEIVDDKDAQKELMALPYRKGYDLMS